MAQGKKEQICLAIVVESQNRNPMQGHRSTNLQNLLPHLLDPTFRSYFWELASEAGLYCRDDHNLSFIKPLRKLFSIQTAECGFYLSCEKDIAKKLFYNACPDD